MTPSLHSFVDIFSGYPTVGTATFLPYASHSCTYQLFLALEYASLNVSLSSVSLIMFVSHEDGDSFANASSLGSLWTE
jgi:hypothetical protein